MAKIKASTLARNPKTGEVEFLEKGATAPAWAVQVITNPAVLDQPKPVEETPESPDSGDGEQSGGAEETPEPEGGAAKRTTTAKK